MALYICRVKNGLKAAPHLLTSGNLLCGMLAIQSILVHHNLENAAWLVLLAGILDFFDGFVARAVKADGEFGKQLDSLADVVTFGIVPAFYLFKWAEYNNPGLWVNYLAFIVGIFSALRLAKFNIDTRQTTGFIGLPTPANALWIVSFQFLANQWPATQSSLITSWFVPTFSILSAFLLVAEWPLFSLKLKNYRLADNLLVYSLLLFGVISFIWLKMGAFALIIPLYLLFNLIPKK